MTADQHQDTLVAAARGDDEAARDPSALSWLMTVVRNACLRMLRPFRRERRLLGERVDAEAGASEQVDPERALERWELVQSVHAAIAALERPYREVLVMRDLEGLSGQQTCEVLGIELATMKTRLHRARTRLREELLRRGDHGFGRETN
jgi:RNA polymerase sigma-70 factor (ECF subfamily)